MSVEKRISLFVLSAAVSSILMARASTQTNQTSKTTPPIPTASQTPGKPSAQNPGRLSASAGQPAPRFVNCHALEMHTSLQPAVSIVVFSQRDKTDHVRLSDLIKENDGAGVELRTSDGKWHKATLVRLRTCFGRGLLFLAADTGAPKNREDFLLRFPPKKIS